MTHDIFNDPATLLSFYDVQAADFRMRHTAIWTEVQHYTWVLSVVLGAGPLTAVSQPALGPAQLGFLLFLPVVGVIIAGLAFLIIKRDFLYYTQADVRLLYIEKQLGITGHSDFLDDRLRRAVASGFNVAQDIKQESAIGLRSVIKGRIRALILLTFIVYMLAGVGEIAYFGLLLFRSWPS